MHWLANSITPQYKPELPPTAAEIALQVSTGKARPNRFIPCPRCLQMTLVGFMRNGVTTTRWTACARSACGYVRAEKF
jgi:hypothetical protein